jgi:hypothetical protein
VTSYSRDHCHLSFGIISNHDGDVNSMAEIGENEVWLHGDMNSMVAMELGGVVEGGLKLDASRW